MFVSKLRARSLFSKHKLRYVKVSHHFSVMKNPKGYGLLPYLQQIVSSSFNGIRFSRATHNANLVDQSPSCGLIELKQFWSSF